MKKLALLLALCLLLSMLPVNGLAEAAAEILSNEEEFAVVSEAAGQEETVLADEGLLLGEEYDVEELREADEAQTPIDLAQGALANVEPQEEDEGETPHTDPNGPQLAANEITLGVGEKFSLNPTLPEGQSGEIYLVSENEAIAQVKEDGTVIAIAPGDTVVTANLEEGVYSECFVHVKKAPDKVSLSPTSLKLGKGEVSEPLSVTVGSKAGKYAGAYSFTSDNAKIVAVNAQGELKGVKVGSTTIRVKTYNGKTASCKVTVQNAPAKVQAAVDKSTLGVGETGKITATLPKNTASGITFESEKPEIVQADAATGEIYGVSVGEARICASTFNGKKAYVTVKVLPAPETLTFPEEAIQVSVGMQQGLQAAIEEGAAGAITYSIADKAVASYAKGMLKGVAKGKTVLVAETYNGLTAECEIKVLAAPKSVTLPYKTLSVSPKQSVKLIPDVGNSVSTFTYATSNKNYVKVNADGVVTGVKKGSATITIKTFNKKSFKLKVNVVNAPASIALTPETLELGVEESATLQYTLPKNTAASVTYASSDAMIAMVDTQTGEVTGVGPGTAVITATTHNGKQAQATVTVFGKPEWIQLPSDFIEIAVGQKYPLEVELSPGSRSPLKYTTKSKKVATVSSKGVVTGVAVGQTQITVKTNVSGVKAKVTVNVLPAPKRVKLATKKLTLNVGETTQMVPSIDKGSYTVYTYTSSNEAVATVSEDGMVATHAKGKAVLTVETHNGLTAKLNLMVLDPWFPDAITLLNAPEYMKAGESLPLEYSTEPEGAIADLRWKSSNEAVATVDEEGVLHALSFGYATITATSARNDKITLTFTLGVETDSVTLAIPARTTKVSGIAKNLEMINAIRNSALTQIQLMKEGGVISSADASKRKSIVENAFKDYAFPWMTLSKQKYWRAANSEGGAKDFKPDRVYYGIPYISGSGRNREYNAAKAVKENRFTDSGNGYYILNQKNLLKGRYCGNDCSCFVDAAIWGTGSGHSNDRTGEIAKSSAYKTVKSYGSLRTGDLICRGGSHVVMFLYYVNAEKTKIMIIENGGIEPGTNTVHCMIMDVKWYTSRGYKIRRLKTLG